MLLQTGSLVSLGALQTCKNGASRGPGKQSIVPSGVACTTQVGVHAPPPPLAHLALCRGVARPSNDYMGLMVLFIPYTE